ncbi:hypothetical protein Tco_0159570 [Tanacetum coccineum]
MFDELLTPTPSVDLPAPEVIAPIDEVVAPVPAESTRSPSLTTVNQDAPLPSNFQTTPKTQPPVIPNDFEEDNQDIEVAHMGNDPYFDQFPQDCSYMNKLFSVTTMLSSLLLNPRRIKMLGLNPTGSKQLDIQSEARRTGRYSKEKGLISGSWLPSRRGN